MTLRLNTLSMKLRIEQILELSQPTIVEALNKYA